MTVKFSPGGELLWTARYGDGTTNWESGKKVLVHGQTNVLVLGDTGSGDILLLKYGQQGNLIWQVTYDGSNHWPP